MFFERDYIMRMIQLMGDFFRKLAQKLDEIERAQMLDEECDKRCGMKLQTARELSAESLCELLPKEPRFVMSELCYIAAELAPMGDREGLMYKSLVLLCSLDRDQELCQARAERLSQLKDELMMQLTAPDLIACARFFYEGERYELMEDAIYQAMDHADASETQMVLDKGLRLLSDATEATNEALGLCGMTREELTQSITTLSLLSQLAMR